MITEDYKNKYEQLTKLIKDLYPFMSDYCKEKAEGIIPELKESEDERISRALISLLKFSLEDDSAIAPGFNETKEQAVAWLEKQGKTSWKPSKEEMDVLYGLSYITNEFDERKEDVITRLYQDLKRVFFNGASFENMFPTNTGAKIEKQSELQYWKPSEEQLEALDYAYNSCPDTEIGNYYEGVLRTLINDLYKLQEKQGEQKPARKIVETWKDMRLEVYQQASGNRHEPNYSDDTTKMFSLNDIDEIIEKMSEQKPDDKVELKFKVGDWVVHNRNDHSREIMQICDIRDGRYYFNDNVHFSWSIKECDEKSRLWTIQDAKDGDVLANNGNIILFKEISNSARKDYKYIQSHCLILAHSSDFYTGGSYNLDDRFHPATKEQRDLLFKKLEEAGYEWDAENKELKGLKKFEKNPAWNEEDERNLKGIISEIEINKFNAPDYDMETYDGFLYWLKSLKDRVQLQTKH